MKLSLNELQVDNYATQVSENELTNIKGGTSASCIRETIICSGTFYYMSNPGEPGEPGSEGEPGDTNSLPHMMNCKSH